MLYEKYFVTYGPSYKRMAYCVSRPNQQIISGTLKISVTTQAPAFPSRATIPWIPRFRHIIYFIWVGDDVLGSGALTHAQYNCNTLQVMST